MINKKQLIKSQKEFADMLGMTVNDYKNYCKNNKINNQNTTKNKKQYSDSILKKLGLNNKDLLIR